MHVIGQIETRPCDLMIFKEEYGRYAGSSQTQAGHVFLNGQFA